MSHKVLQKSKSGAMAPDFLLCIRSRDAEKPRVKKPSKPRVKPTHFTFSLVGETEANSGDALLLLLVS